MKKLTFVLLVCLVFGLFGGCSAEPAQVTLTEQFTLVVAEDAPVQLRQAALSIQAHLKWSCGLELPVEASASGKTVRLQVKEDPSGKYTVSVSDTGVTLSFGSADTAPIATRQLLRQLPADLVIRDGALSGQVKKSEAPFLALCQNVRGMDDPGGNMIVSRIPRMLQLLTQYGPDIICLQEDSKGWPPALDKALGECYGVTGQVGLDSLFGARQSIYYRLDRYSLTDSGVFWLSDTPDVPESKLESSNYVRHCTWALLQDGFTGRDVLICNIHLESTNGEARRAQLQIFFDYMAEKLEAYPTVICGDFNSRPTTEVYATMTGRYSDPHVTALEKLSDTEITCDKYGTWDRPGRLDYLFYNEDLVATRYRVMTDQYDGYVSDHYGITAEYCFAD